MSIEIVRKINDSLIRAKKAIVERNTWIHVAIYRHG